MLYLRLVYFPFTPVNFGMGLAIFTAESGLDTPLAAGMSCVTVTTEFTRTAVHESGLLDDRLIVDIPSELPSVVEQLIDEDK